MKSTVKAFYRYFLAKFVLAGLSVFMVIIFAPPVQALALNSNMVQGEVYWIDEATDINYDDDSFFQGFTKYIADSEEGAFYLFTRFTDYRIDPSENENITLSFVVKNSKNTYRFDVDKTGMINTSSPNTSECIEVYYNFSEASCKRRGGGIYVAFELKNAQDRKLNNYVSCEYYCGLNRSYSLFDSVCINMYKAEEDKTLNNSSTVKHNESGSDKSKASGSSSNSASSKSGTTKFSASGSAGYSSETGEGAQDNTKFSAGGASGSQSGSASGSSSSSSGDEDHSDNQITDVSISPGDDENGEYKSTRLSTAASVLTAVGIIILAAGIICVAAGVFRRRSKKHKLVEKEEKQHQEQEK